MNASSEYRPNNEYIMENISGYDEYKLIKLMFETVNLEIFQKCLEALVLKVSNNIPRAKSELTKDELEDHINVLKEVLDRFGRNALWRLENKAKSLGLCKENSNFVRIRMSLYGSLVAMYRNMQIDRVNVSDIES